jgi:hypothetical protein
MLQPRKLKALSAVTTQFTRVWRGAISLFKGISNMNEKQLSTNQILLERQQIYTDREAAQFLRIGQTTLWRLRRNGKISFRRASNKIIYTQSDLENYLSSTKREAFGRAA